MKCRLFAAVLALLLCVAAQAVARDVLLVSAAGGWSKYDCATGAYLGQLITSSGTRVVSNEPGGTLDICAGSSIFRYDVGSGASLGTISLAAYPGGCEGMAWGPDGRLYIANTGSNRILRCDVSTGAIEVVPLSANVIKPCGVTFGTDGDLYVCAYWSDSSVTRQVGRIRLSDGSLVETYAGMEDLQSPQQIASTRDGSIYALDQCASGLYALDRAAGCFEETAPGGPDLGFMHMAAGTGGDIFLMQWQSPGIRSVYRYNQETHSVSYFAPGGTGYVAVATVPEPSGTVALLTAFGALIGAWRLRRR